MLGFERVRRSAWTVGSFALGIALLVLFFVADIVAPRFFKPKVYFIDTGGRLVVLQQGMPKDDVRRVLDCDLREHTARFGGSEAFAASPALRAYVFRFSAGRLQSVRKTDVGAGGPGLRGKQRY